MRVMPIDQPGRLRLARRLIPAASALLFVFVYVTAVLTRHGQRLEDRALSAAATAHATPPLLQLVTVPDLFVITVIIIITGLVRERRESALRALCVLAVSNLATQILKYSVLQRPDLANLLTENTFPSGHTTAWVSVLFASILVLPPRARALLAIPGAIVCSTVVVELLGFGWHRLSDIVGATALVTTITTVAIMSIRERRPQVTSPKLTSVVLRILAVGVIGAVAVAVTSFAVALFGHVTVDDFILLGTEAVATASIMLAFFIVLLFLGHFRRPQLSR